MILKVFAVRDTKAQAFLQPFYSPSVGSALRAFSDAVNDGQCPFNKHPEDYILYEIGSYDDATAALDPLDVVRLQVAATDLVDVKKDLPKNVVYDKTVNLSLDESINGKK